MDPELESAILRGWRRVLRSFRRRGCEVKLRTVRNRWAVDLAVPAGWSDEDRAAAVAELHRRLNRLQQMANPGARLRLAAPVRYEG